MSKFTKKHYEAFAAEIREYRCLEKTQFTKMCACEIVSLCCRLFLSDNPRFSCDRFEKACFDEDKKAGE